MDIKIREVPDFAVLSLFLFSFLVLTWQELGQNLLFALAVFTILLALSLATGEGIGGGDIKLLSALALYMGKDLYILAFPMTILLAGTIIWALIARKGWRYEIPFVPYIFLSYLVYLGVYLWNLAYLA